jgi:hypothetical protein
MMAIEFGPRRAALTPWSALAAISCWGLVERPAPYRSQGEQHAAAREHAPTPQVITQLATYQNQRSQKERVSRHYPLGVHRGSS